MPRLPNEELAAFVGLDWADANPDVCLQAVGDHTRAVMMREHTPATIAAWACPIRTRFEGRPVAVGLELNKGPLVYALRKDEFLVLFPSNPLPLAKSRDACTPSHAKDDPPDAERPLELLLTHRDKLTPLHSPSPARRAREQLVEQRRRLVGDKVRLTNRLTRALKHYFPQVLQWFDAKDTTIFCDFLAPWPTLTAVPLARRPTLEAFFRTHHGRYVEVIDHRIRAIKSATPLPPAAGLIAPNALLVQALVSPLRVTLHAIETFDHAIAQRAQSQPDCPLCAAVPGAGAVCAPRLLVAFGAPRHRYTSADALPK
jgi:transposase